MLGWSPSLGGRTEASAVVGALSTGTIVTSGGANTKGSWVSIVTASGAWGSLGIDVGPWSGSVDFLVDIAKSTDGSNFSILVPDLHVPAFGVFSGGVSVTLPIAVPAGSGLYARAQAVGASAQVSCMLRGGPGLWGSPGYSRAVALYTPASSRGTSIDPGGSANTKGSWVSLSTGVTQSVAAVLALVGNDAQTTRSVCTWLVDIGCGVSGSQQVIVDNVPLAVAATPATITPNVLGPFERDVAPSTAFWARAQCSITTAARRTIDIGLYGLAP